MSGEARAEKLIVSNRRARHDYHILETVEAGIALQGTEVKSLRAGKANLQDCYAIVRGGEVWLLNMHISPYTHGSYANHLPTRERRLLLHAKEIRKLAAHTAQKGHTLVPLKIYLKGRCMKVELAVAQGKQLHDKRASIKERDVARSMARGEE
jgi:SsrA-binding protein